MEAQTDADIVLVAEDGYSGIPEYEASTIRDAKSLNKFYSRINRTRKPGLPVPVVDFSKEMVIVVCLGEQKGGQNPVLNKSTETEEGVTLSLQLVPQKTKDSESQQLVSYPFYVYKMPLTTKKVDINKAGW